MLKSIVSFFSFVALIVSLFAPVAMADIESASNFYTAQYVPGKSAEFTGISRDMPGMPTAPRGDWGQAVGLDNAGIAALSFAAYGRCESDYPKACRVKVIGYSDALSYDRLHDPLNGGLAAERAGRVGNLIRPQLGERGATVVEIEAAAETANVGQRYVHVRVYVATAIALPEAKPVVTVPVDPNARWGFLNKVLLRQTDNLCPTLVTANASTRTYTLQYSSCECSSWDAKSSTSAIEINSDLAWTQMVRQDRDKWAVADDLVFVEIRERLEEGTTSYVVEVNENLDEERTSDGLSVTFLETETTLTVRFPDRCSSLVAQRELQKKREEEERKNYENSLRLQPYLRAAFFKGVQFSTGAISKTGNVYEFNPGPELSLRAIGGLITPSGWMVGLGLGVGHNPNCFLPATLDASFIGGFQSNRAGKVGWATDLTYTVATGPFNGAWTVNAHRVELATGLAIHPKGDLEGPNVLLQGRVGADLITAAVNGGDGTYVSTAAPVGGVKLTVIW